MTKIDINEYLNKINGNHLPAEQWNALHQILQSKTNEIVDAVNNLNELIVDIEREQTRLNNGIEITDYNVVMKQDLRFDGDHAIESYDRNGLCTSSLNLSDVVRLKSDESIYFQPHLNNSQTEIELKRDGMEVRDVYDHNWTYITPFSIKNTYSDGDESVSDFELTQDGNVNIIARNKIEGSGFKTHNGTANQFLMADGSTKNGGISGTYQVGSFTFEFENGMLVNALVDASQAE